MVIRPLTRVTELLVGGSRTIKLLSVLCLFSLLFSREGESETSQSHIKRCLARLELGMKISE